MRTLFAAPVGALLAAVLSAQEPEDDPIAAAREAFEGLVRAGGEDDKLLKETVRSLLSDEKKGIAWLAARLQDSRGPEAEPRRSRVVHSVVCQVGLRYLDRVDESKMVFAGQYDPLRALMPEVGDFYLDLLIATPQWYPDDQRARVVPALRDLYPKGPGEQSLRRIETMVENAEIEPEHLRLVLSYALAQWGDRRFLKERIRVLERNARAEDAETSLLALRDLAALHYGIRDYAVAAVRHREFLTKAEAEDYYIRPVDYYNAACCMNLSGDVRSALEYLRRCLRLNGSSKIDPSVRLARKLFEEDPEIRAVRKSKEFAAMLEEAFGTRPEGDR